MKKAFILLFFLFNSLSYSQDTTFVQAHDYVDLDWYGNYDAMAEFPDNDVTYRKILMHYDMRCSSSGCSGWDYTTKISLLQPTDDLDENGNIIYAHDQTIANVITPYGTYMQGNGTEGFSPNWVQRYTYDVTDFAPLLKGPVMMRAFYGGWSTGFNVTTSFEFIEGTPPRNVIDIQNLWSGSNSYADIQSILSETLVNIPSEVKNSMLRITISGHGQDGEFTPGVNYFVDVNGSNVYTQEIWRDDCGEVALYPQGGTWVYDRANWCPGDKATTRNHELTSFINNGEDNFIDFDIYRPNWNPSEASYIYDVQLFTYEEPNFQIDAVLEDIISPSSKQEYFRFNPTCSNPIIEIKNNGSDILSSAEIYYGFEGYPENFFYWEGSLEFGETEIIELQPISFYSWTENIPFKARIAKPNGSQDLHNVNDILFSDYELVEEYPNTFCLWLKTNDVPGETSYEVKDNFGNIVYSRNNMDANTLYKDTMVFEPGCYSLQLLDTGGNQNFNEDGLSWWANNDGNGYARLREVPGGYFKYYQADFGTELTDYFRVGNYSLSTNNDNNLFCDIYPNPSTDNINVHLEFSKAEDLLIELIDYNGKIIKTVERTNFTNDIININTNKFKSGIYFILIKTNENFINKKIIIH